MGTVEKLRRKRAAREVAPLVAEEPAS
jgi:hypothetical protein